MGLSGPALQIMTATTKATVNELNLKMKEMGIDEWINNIIPKNETKKQKEEEIQLEPMSKE
jgi:hypothetical protein